MKGLKTAFLDLGCGDVGHWHSPTCSLHERWGDHGMALLVTLAHQHGYQMDVVGWSGLHSLAEWRMIAKRYDIICMNVRSWRYAYAKRAAEIAKSANPNVQIWVGGFHATVCKQEMLDIEAFDVIVSREAEGTFLELLANGGSKERFIEGSVGQYTNLDDLPFIDREVWPKAPGSAWPLESPGGWGPGPRAATLVTSRACPWHCSFCYPAERNHFNMTRRRSVSHVLGELAYIKQRWEPITSVVYHDSEFLMHKAWLEEYLERYPKEAGYPFWASCRADVMARWPDLVRALHREANWHCFSIGLESGSQKVLDIMNKETTVEQNLAAIELVNQLGDEAIVEGRRPPVIFANVMLGIPGEEPEDAFATVRMLGTIRRGIPSLSLFTPYPGSTLGDEVIARGDSLDTLKHYHRFPNEPKCKGIDYQFYANLFAGKYDSEVGFSVPAMMSRQGSAGEALV